MLNYCSKQTNKRLNHPKKQIKIHSPIINKYEVKIINYMDRPIKSTLPRCSVGLHLKLAYFNSKPYNIGANSNMFAK